MAATQPNDRSDPILQAAARYAVATAEGASADLFTPLTFLLAQVRKSLKMDVVFVSQFVDGDRVFEVVSSEGEKHPLVVPGSADPLIDTYCQRVAEGRIPAIVADTALHPEVASLPITSSLSIRAYLSAPVVLPGGRVFGTVCCISHQPRADLRQRDADALAAVAEAVAASVGGQGRIRYAAWNHPDTGTAR